MKKQKRKRKAIEQQKNKNNHGRVKELKEFYNCSKWKKARKIKMIESKGLCERCKKAGKISAAYIVHHKTYLNIENYKNFKDALSLENLETLCVPCHNSEHFSTVNRFDDEGNLLEI